MLLFHGIRALKPMGKVPNKGSTCQYQLMTFLISLVVYQNLQEKIFIGMTEAIFQVDLFLKGIVYFC